MSAATSPTSAESYGVERVCRIFETPRSTYYAHLELVPILRPPPERRGPKPKVSDDELLEYIEADLKSSPFHGEGHRKVWARLRVLRDVRVSAKRVLRVMREIKLLLQAAVQIDPVMAVEMSPSFGEPGGQGSLVSPDGVGCPAQHASQPGCPVQLFTGKRLAEGCPGAGLISG